MTILAQIKDKIREGKFRFSLHCLEELYDEGFTEQDAVKAIRNAPDFDKLTEDLSHVRYVLFGRAGDGRDLNVVVFFSQGTLVIKTAYEELG